MDKNRTVQLAPSSVTAEGVSLNQQSLPRAEMLISGQVLSAVGNLVSFCEEYPIVDLVTELRWSDMFGVRSATCGPLSCLLIEGPKVADTQVLMIIPLTPAQKVNDKFSVGANRLKEELANRIASGQIHCLPGDLNWITKDR